MLMTIKEWLTQWGLQVNYSDILARLMILAMVIVLAVLSDVIAKRYLLRFLKYIVTTTRTRWDDILYERKVFNHLAHLVPAIIVYISVNLIFPDLVFLRELVKRAALAYMILIGALVIDALLNAMLQIYRNFQISRNKPIKSYIQVGKIFLYVISTILIIATLLDKSPWAFLSGIGALTAVIMLVFKDSILGFVASIQLAANDMVRVGDWIEMPKYGADGDVMDVSLNTIKVQNWDKTVTSIPTYALISESFKNWRGMSESGGRRIKRPIYIDMNSIKFCDEEMIERFKKIQYISDYIERKKEEINLYNKEANIDLTQIVNGRRMTNVGTMRAYLESYLKNHPKIHQDMTFLIRQLAPTEHGLPLEIYVFSNDQVWANYEAIQADIFDHILAVVPEFDLKVFQSPSGRDLQILADKCS